MAFKSINQQKLRRLSSEIERKEFKILCPICGDLSPLTNAINSCLMSIAEFGLHKGLTAQCSECGAQQAIT